MVLGDVCVHDPAQSVIDLGFLMQSHADAPYDTTHDLTMRCFGVEDASGSNGVDDTGDADHTELFIHPHLRKDRRMCVSRVRITIVERVGALPLDAIEATMTHRVGDRYRSPCVLFVDDLAVAEKREAATS